jgi:4-hydroxyphenylpyruvate dioxygenase
MKIDCVHFYVEDAKAWRNWFISYLGFQPIANFLPFLPSGLGELHTCTEVVRNGEVCFVFSSPLSPASPVADFLHLHPPGVADITFSVEDVETAIAHAQAGGAKILQPIQEQQEGETYIKWGKIAAWGRLVHTLIERGEGEQGNRGEFELTTTSANVFTAIDHIVLNVAPGDLELAVAWYGAVLDFQPQQMFKIKTERSGLHSQVMISRCGRVQLPINEPASSNSQIQEFLDANRGPGIQHIALQTPNIIKAIAQFRSRGLSLLSVPETYYSQLKQRSGLTLSATELKAIAQQEILVDWREDNPHAVLLQIFTQPIFPQPTFFLEFIHRQNQAVGFGEGNFRALFEAIEEEQIKRGKIQQ